MTDTPSPFDDPEFVEKLNRSGITHRPGMADEFLKEIGPLLSADGIDMDNPDQEMDLDHLNAAMGRAVERHNMELVTPVGDARSLTVNTLREFVRAFGNPRLEDTIFDRLRPDPTKHHPSFSHLMGVASETLDTWYSDRTLRASLKRVTFADVPKQVKPVVNDLVALARKGRAFRSIDRLLAKHNGALVAMAGAYAVAASLITVATHRQQPIRSVLDEFLPGDEIGGGAGSGAAFGAAAAQQVSSKERIGAFEQWLVNNDGVALNPPEDIEVFEMIVDATTGLGLDPFEADDYAEIVDVVLDLENPAVVTWSLAILHDYVHYRLEGDDSELWEAPHEKIREASADAADRPDELMSIMEGLQDIPEEERYTAVTATSLIAGMPKLVEWLGKSKPVTSTGMPRRADISAAAALIGLDAQGTPKAQPMEITDATMQVLDLSKPAPKQPTRYVQSAKELGEFRAWWAALEIHGGIELKSTRVLPGPQAEDLATHELDDLELLEMFIVTYIREYLLGATEAILGDTVVLQTVRELLALAQADDVSAEQPLGAPFAARHLRSFESMGLLEIRNGSPFIPEPLRPIVIMGVLMAMEDLEPEQ